MDYRPEHTDCSGNTLALLIIPLEFKWRWFLVWDLFTFMNIFSFWCIRRSPKQKMYHLTFTLKWDSPPVMTSNATMTRLTGWSGSGLQLVIIFPIDESIDYFFDWSSNCLVYEVYFSDLEVTSWNCFLLSSLKPPRDSICSGIREKQHNLTFESLEPDNVWPFNK